MPLFHITLREHTYTGRFYNDVVEAGSFEEALRLAAGQATPSRPPPGSGQRSFNVTLREHTCAGRFHNDVVEAGSFEEALRLAAGQATGPRRRLVSGRSQTARIAGGVPMSGSTPCCTAGWQRGTIRRTWPSHVGTAVR